MGATGTPFVNKKGLKIPMRKLKGRVGGGGWTQRMKSNLRGEIDEAERFTNAESVCQTIPCKKKKDRPCLHDVDSGSTKKPDQC